jgi:hypothetical protein
LSESTLPAEGTPAPSPVPPQVTGPAAASALNIAGPPASEVLHASSPLTVSVNGRIDQAVVVTPAATGDGVFSPPRVTLTPAAPSASFEFTPAVSGNMLITLTNTAGLANPRPLPFESQPAEPPQKPAPPALALTGPATGEQFKASDPFTVRISGELSDSVSVTPTATVAGTFTPRVVTLFAGSPSVTFTFTPSIAGRLQIGVANDSGLVAPPVIAFESHAPAPVPDPAVPRATALHLAGPVSGLQNNASAPFTVSANGALDSALVVRPTSTGSGTFTPSTVTLTAGTPTATFVYTPSRAGAAQIGLTSDAGLSAPKPLPFESRAVTFDRGTRAPVWYVDANPARPFGTSQGTIPAGAGDKGRLENLLEASVETVRDDNPRDYLLHQKYDVVLPTEVQRGVVTPTFPTLQRVRDPADASKWVYYHRINRLEVGIDGSEVTPASVPDSYRSEVVVARRGNGYTPTGTEEWAVCGIRLPSYWRLIDTRKDWYVFFQYHDSSRGLTGNPPIAVGWTGGNGTATQAKFNWIVRRYHNPDWPRVVSDRSNRTAYAGVINNPAADAWHWLVFHYRSGCGFLDPAKGAIYGPTDAKDCFVRLYHAVGDGEPYLAGAYTGFWGSPYDPADRRIQALRANQAFPENGYWRSGIYLKSWFLPASLGNDRNVYSKGHRVYRAADSPGMTVQDVLSDFRGN